MTTRGARPDWEPITLSGDESGRDRLVLEHIPLLKHIVGRMLAPTGVERQQPFALGNGPADLELPLACLRQLGARVERLCPGSGAQRGAQAGGKHGR